MFDIKQVIDAARIGSSPQVLLDTGRSKIIFVPHGAGGVSTITEHDYEKTLPFPVRKRGAVAVYDVSSFNQLLSDNKDGGNITIYADHTALSPIVAVMNGHGSGGPGWGDFRISLEFRLTNEWQRWESINGKMMAQVDFAEFIEENIADIATPPGAEMLEIVQYLTMTKSVNFKSAIRLSDGQTQFRNEESVETKVRASEAVIPPMLTLGLVPMVGLPAYAVQARFRYRLSDGRLTLGVRMERLDVLKRQIVTDVIDSIVAPDGAAIVNGKAPA